MTAGARWKRRTRQDDPYDEVVTVGPGPSGGLVVRPVAGFSTPLEVDATELGAQYELTVAPTENPADEWVTRLEELTEAAK